MAADVQIRFLAESKQAQREINQLEKEVQELRQQLGTAEKAANTAGNEIQQMGNQSRQAAEGVDRLGDEAKEAQIGVTSLGRAVFKTSAEAKRFGGVFLDQHGIIRESNGNFARTRETIDKLGDEARESAREVNLLGDQLERAGRGTTGFTRATDGASRGSQIFTRALGGIGRALGAFGIASAGRLLAEFGTSSVKAAGELEQYVRATEQITGSAEAAAARIASLEEIANLPGLNFEALTRFSNRLIAAGVSGSDADKILLTVGQTVVSLGGDASKAALAMEQLIQAIQLGTIDMRDFRTIVQQIPGFLEVLGDVHGVAANLDGLHEAFDRVGGNMRDLLIPTFDELARRYESPPPESYIVSIDRLQNSFFLLRAELGEKVLPLVSATARGLADLFDGIRDILDSGLPTQTATDFAIGLEKINSAASRQQGIEDRINALRRLELTLKAERSGLSESSDEYLSLSKQIQAAQTEQDRWNTILEGSPQAAAALESEIAGLNERFQTLNDRLNQTEGTRTAASLAQTQRQFDEVSTSLSLANTLLGDVQNGFEETAAATDEGTTATRGFVSSIEDFGGVLNEVDTRFLTFHERVAAYQATIRTLPSDITEVSDAFSVLNPFAAAAAAQFENLNLSLRDAEAEASAFQSTISEVGNLFDRYIAGLEATSVSADKAFGRINNVGEAVRNADFRTAEERLRDFDDAFKLSEATIPRVTSEMARFAGQVPQATEEVTEFRRELETLNRTGQEIDLSSVADALNIGADPLQGAQPGGRDAYTQYLKDNAIAIGEELGSQAIRTTAELRRIERDRVESLADLEQQYSDRIVAINERKREQLAKIEQDIETERVRRLAAIQQVFDDAAQAEVDARQDAADRILSIENRAVDARERLRERLNERLIALETQRDERIQDLSDGYTERERERQQEILEITQRATDARIAAETRYSDEVQAINNQLVEDVLAVQQDLQSELESLEAGFVTRQSDRADEIVRITQDAADARAAANQQFTDTMEGIYRDLVLAWDTLEDDFTERQADRAQERVEIEQRAASARVAANETYAERLAEISTDLVDEIRGIEAEIAEVQRRHADERLSIEQESLEARVAANTDYTEAIARIEADREHQLSEQTRRLEDLQREASENRLAADRDYADEFQGIQNDLVDTVVDIQRRLNSTLADLRQDEIETEQDRLNSIAELHEETADRIADIERGRVRTIEDLNRKLRDDIYDARLRAHRQLEDINADTGLDEEQRAERIAKIEADVSRRIEDLTRNRNRRIGDLALEEHRQREDLARRQAESEIEIAERAAARLTQIEQRSTDARAQAETGIAAAEAEAGVSFADAQRNYVPALNSHEQALLAHAEALNRIAAETESGRASVNQEIANITETAFQDTATAANALAESLAAVDRAAQQQLTDLETATSGTLAGLRGEITDAETQTGLTFEQALQNYTPAVDLNTQALQALTAALDQAESDRTSALGALDAAGVADSLSTRAAQAELEAGAGVSIDEARANFVPALSSAAQATLTLNQTIQDLDTSFQEAIAELQNAGLVDRQALDRAIQTAIDEATSQITALETQAGTTFAAASAAFQPELSGIGQAEADRAAALGGINQTERDEIGTVNAQSIADQLNTDAAITATRDTYIKARDTEILKHNTAILQLNLAEAADIREVKDALKVNLASIDDNISAELAEVREQKVAFDTKMNALITAVNTQANQDVLTLNEDTAAMRVELEAIAEEARDNAWKGALAKMANVGITIAGVAAGTALGNPVAGLAIGQAVGGLVEQGANELFHFEQTDAIARRIAREAALSQPRAAPNYLPTPDQLRNARDVGREVVAGFTEGLATRGGGGDSSPQQVNFPEEFNATIVIQYPTGAITELRDQIVRLQTQSRSL